MNKTEKMLGKEGKEKVKELQDINTGKRVKVLMRDLEYKRSLFGDTPAEREIKSALDESLTHLQWVLEEWI